MDHHEKLQVQEGWDCPFAYILVSLNNTGSGQSMTQLVGRVLRQPYQERTPFQELNESYIYCLYQRAGTIAAQVKTALEKEGYEGEAAGLVVDATDEETLRRDRVISIRPQFARMYTSPFKGKIYLPRFCVKEGKGKNAEYRPLDYFEHLISCVDVNRFAYSKIDWYLTDEIRQAKDRFYRISIGTDLTREYETDLDLVETDEQVLAWVAAGLRFDFLSTKQIRSIVRAVYDQLVRGELLLKDRLATVKSVVRDKIEGFVQDQLDSQTEAAFREYFERRITPFLLGMRRLPIRDTGRRHDFGEASANAADARQRSVGATLAVRFRGTRKSK